MAFCDRASGFERNPFERSMFVFSYDISSPKHARSARRVVKRWRLDGQLSVHEAIVTPAEAKALGAELAEWVDPKTDSLMVFRLSGRGHGPVMLVSALRGPGYALQPERMPRFPADGTYVLAYDVRDRLRLRRVQRAIRSEAIFLQRSVYLYQGSGAGLMRLTGRLQELLDLEADDCRVYVMANSEDLWFFAGSAPFLAGLGASSLDFTQAA